MNTKRSSKFLIVKLKTVSQCFRYTGGAFCSMFKSTLIALSNNIFRLIYKFFAYEREWVIQSNFIIVDISSFLPFSLFSLFSVNCFVLCRLQTILPILPKFTLRLNVAARKQFILRFNVGYSVCISNAFYRWTNEKIFSRIGHNWAHIFCWSHCQFTLHHKCIPWNVFGNWFE